jgi:hypothetical protein
MQGDRDGLAGGDRDAPDLRVLDGRPGESDLDDRDVAEQLLDRGVHEIRLLTQPIPSRPVLEEHHRAQRDQARCRFVPGDEQFERETADLVHRQVRAVDQIAQEVVPAVRSFRGDHPADVLRELGIRQRDLVRRA